jgi:hypothetical protein
LDRIDVETPVDLAAPSTGDDQKLAVSTPILDLLKRKTLEIGGGSDALEIITEELKRNPAALTGDRVVYDNLRVVPVHLPRLCCAPPDETVGPLGGPRMEGEDVALEPVAPSQPARPSRVIPEPVDAAASDVDALSRALRGYQAQIKACYDLALKADPGLAGRLELELDISGGRARAVRVDGELGHRSPALASCVSAKARRWAFDPAIADTVLVPYTFTAG